MYKDVVYHRMRKAYRQDIKEHPLLDHIGMEAPVFDTLDNVFSGSSPQPGISNQPIIHSPNLHHVIQTAKDDGRPLDVMAGICMFGYGRVCVTYGDFAFDLWVMPQEIDPMGEWELKDRYTPIPKKWDPKKTSHGFMLKKVCGQM